MSTLSYNIGFALGTVTRELLSAVKSTSVLPVTQPKASPPVQLPLPCVPDSLVREMDRLPAMVRTKGIDLNHWYAANTRLVQKAPRKRRTRTRSVDPARPGSVGPLMLSAC